MPVAHLSGIMPFSNIKLNQFLRTGSRVSDVLFKCSFNIKSIPGDLLFSLLFYSVSLMGSL